MNAAKISWVFDWKLIGKRLPTAPGTFWRRPGTVPPASPCAKMHGPFSYKTFCFRQIAKWQRAVRLHDCGFDSRSDRAKTLSIFPKIERRGRFRDVSKIALDQQACDGRARHARIICRTPPKGYEQSRQHPPAFPGLVGRTGIRQPVGGRDHCVPRNPPSGNPSPEAPIYP
jgi:hypothetical protein